jgi:hypothetical protein
MLDMNTNCNPGAFLAFSDQLQAPIELLFRALLMYIHCKPNQSINQLKFY